MALLQGADCSRKEIMARLEIGELEAKGAEARLVRVRDAVVLGMEPDDHPIFQVK